jgi:hypothetical protein
MKLSKLIRELQKIEDFNQGAECVLCIAAATRRRALRVQSGRNKVHVNQIKVQGRPALELVFMGRVTYEHPAPSR